MKKGYRCLKRIKNQLAYVEATFNEVGAWNPCLYKPVDKNSRRKDFFEKWNNKTITEAVLELQVSNKDSSQSTRRVNFLLEKIKRVLYRR